ncbi:hypothetical protein II906_08670 [bacterium]|nr:hypothetical protein [bacterium]
MRISAINNQVNFGQVTKVKSITNATRPIERKEIDKHTQAVIDVLNNKEQDIYSAKEAGKIRKFFKKNIPDYTGKNMVEMKRLNGDLYLFTGSSAVFASNADSFLRMQEGDIDDDEKIPSGLKPVYKKLAEDEFNSILMEDYYIDRKSVVLHSNDVDVAKLTEDHYNGNMPIDGKIDKFYCYEKTEQKDCLVI